MARVGARHFDLRKVSQGSVIWTWLGWALRRLLLRQAGSDASPLFGDGLLGHG